MLSVLGLLLGIISPLPIWPGPPFLRHLPPGILSAVLVILACLGSMKKGSRAVGAIAIVYGVLATLAGLFFTIISIMAAALFMTFFLPISIVVLAIGITVFLLGCKTFKASIKSVIFLVATLILIIGGGLGYALMSGIFPIVLMHISPPPSPKEFSFVSENGVEYKVISIVSGESSKEGEYAVLKSYMATGDLMYLSFKLVFPTQQSGKVKMEMILPDFPITITVFSGSREMKSRWNGVEIERSVGWISGGYRKGSEHYPAKTPTLIEMSYIKNATVITLNIENQSLQFSSDEKEGVLNNVKIRSPPILSFMNQMLELAPSETLTYGPAIDTIYVWVESFHMQYFTCKIRLVSIEAISEDS